MKQAKKHICHSDQQWQMCFFDFPRLIPKLSSLQSGYSPARKIREFSKGGQRPTFGSGSSNRGEQHPCRHEVSRGEHRSTWRGLQRGQSALCHTIFRQEGLVCYKMPPWKNPRRHFDPITSPPPDSSPPTPSWRRGSASGTAPAPTARIPLSAAPRGRPCGL